MKAIEKKGTNNRKTKGKFYVVFKGFKPGIYKNWRAMSKATDGFKSPYFGKFDSHGKAKRALKGYRYWEKSLCDKKALKNKGGTKKAKQQKLKITTSVILESGS